MTPGDLQKHMFEAYFWLRRGMAIIAVLFPVILVVGGWFWHGIPVQGSMSAYYHATIGSKPGSSNDPSIDTKSNTCNNDSSQSKSSICKKETMRDFFVGLLVALGIFLLLYKGYHQIEDWLLDTAGVFAFLVAIFPMPWPEEKFDIFDFETWTLHGTSAVLLFVCLALVCWLYKSESLKKMNDQRLKKRFETWYNLIAGFMIILTVLVMAFLHFLDKPDYKTLVLEAAGIWVFSTYWWLKSYELRITDAERLALEGKFDVEPLTQSDP